MVNNLATKYLWVLDPTSKAKFQRAYMADRPKTLNGKVLGILVNPRPNAEKLVDIITELVSQKFRLANIVKMRTSDQSKVAPSATLDCLAKQCHIAIVGVGD
jgi:hypothetical protein